MRPTCALIFVLIDAAPAILSAARPAVCQWRVFRRMAGRCECGSGADAGGHHAPGEAESAIRCRQTGSTSSRQRAEILVSLMTTVIDVVINDGTVVVGPAGARPGSSDSGDEGGSCWTRGDGWNQQVRCRSQQFFRQETLRLQCSDPTPLFDEHQDKGHPNRDDDQDNYDLLCVNSRVIGLICWCLLIRSRQ